MRTILLEWLIEVHHKFKLCPNTLFKAIQIIDLYLSLNDMSKKNLQTLGIVVLFMASKYEDIYPPSVIYLISSDIIFTFRIILALMRIS